MMVIEVAGNAIAQSLPLALTGFDPNLKLSRLVISNQRLWRTNITFAVGREFEKLTVTIDVACWRFNVSVSLDNEHPLFAAFIGENTPKHTGWNYQIIPRLVAERSVLALQYTTSLMDENYFITVGKPIPIRHRFCGTSNG